MIDPRAFGPQGATLTEAQFRELFERSTVPILPSAPASRAAPPPRGLDALLPASPPLPGPMSYWDEGGGSTPGVADAPSSAPAATPNAAGTFSINTSFPNMISNAVQGNALATPNPGFFSNPTAQGAINSAVSLGLGGLISALGLGPASLVSSALGKLSQFALNRGLEGIDTSGLASPAGLAAMNQGGPIDNATFATLTQGLGLTNAQLDAISAHAPFGQEPAPSDPGPADVGQEGVDSGTTTSGTSTSGTGDPSSDGGTGATGVGGVGTGGVGEAAYRRGGTVRRTGLARLHEAEEVVRASEARRPGVRAALKIINRPGVSGLERLLRENG